MPITKFFNRLKKNASLRKKTFVIATVGILGVVGLIFLGKTLNDNMLASVTDLTFSTWDTCFDTDGGSNVLEKGTITVIENGMTRTEQDQCNNNWTLRERFCGNYGDPAGLLRSENFVDCGYGSQCNDWACVPAPVDCSDPEVVLACSLGLNTCPPECTWYTTPAVDCNTPENVLACSLQLDTCPPECVLNCTDPNMLYACANCDTPDLRLACALGLDTCPQVCQSSAVTNTWLACPSQCATAVCTDPNIEWACNHGYTYACPIACQNPNSGYGYGYGYRSTGNNDGYGYGYGYVKLDLVTKKPYIYLIDVFKKYSEKAYQLLMRKTKKFQMPVKFYNTKEFKQPTKR